MALWCDMLPDPNWKKRGSVGADRRNLSVERVCQLDAALSVRNGLFWSIIFATYSGMTKVDNDAFILLNNSFAILFLVFLLVWTIVGFMDGARINTVKSYFYPVVPREKPLHIFEEFAVPLLIFMAILGSIFFWPVSSALVDAYPSLGPFLKVVKTIALSPPWMGLCAAMISVGAYFRYQLARVHVSQLQYDPA